MKNLFRIFSVFTLLSFLAVSCGDDTTEEKSPPPPDTPPVADTEITAVLPSFLAPSTRADIDIAENEVYWKKGDKLSVYYNDDVNFEFRLDRLSANLTEGVFATDETFEWDAEAEAHQLYAVYPYNENNTDISAIKVDLPSQFALNSESEACESGLFLVGSANYESAEKPFSIEMQCPLKVIHIILDGSRTILDGGNVQNISLVSDEMIVGEATYNVSEGKFTGFDKKSVEFVFDKGKKLSAQTHLYFYINPEADLAEAGLKLAVNADIFDAEFDVRVDSDSSGPIEINASQALSDMDGTISINGTVSNIESNSYMLRPGEHIILPVSRAFSVWKTNFNQPLDENAELGYKVMWIDTDGGLSSEGTLNAISMFDEDKGTSAGIFVKAGSRPGNALIALTADDEIVWSWHIWVTEYDPNAQNNKIGKFVFMNRNMGAINTKPGDVGSKGYLYQFGRKDPFPCHDPDAPISPFYLLQHRSWWNEEGKLLVHGDEDFPGTEDIPKPDGLLFSEVKNGGAEIDGIMHATRRPTTFLYHPGDALCVLWTTTQFMPPPQLLNTLWDTYGGGGAKTVFDPCPAGWRIPNEINFIYDLQAEAGIVPADVYGNPPKENPYSEDNPFYEIGTGADFGKYGYFPAIGYMVGMGAAEGGACKEDGESGAYWIATAGGFGGRAFFFNREGRGVDDHMVSTDRATGHAVRCVKE